MAKLTLHVPEELVAAAKSAAEARQVSVSKLVTDYFRHITAKRPETATEPAERLAPRTPESRRVHSPHAHKFITTTNLN